LELARWPQVDGELRVFTDEYGYEVRHENNVVARVGDPTFSAVVPCVTRDGHWQFERLRGGDTEATLGTAVIARYDSNLLPGGKIELLDGTRFRLRPPVVGETWRVPRVLEITRTAGPYKVRFREAAREVSQLPLLTMFAFHAMLVEHRPGGGGGGGDGAVGF
jgi:hypothetical protein